MADGVPPQLGVGTPSKLIRHHALAGKSERRIGSNQILMSPERIEVPFAPHRACIFLMSDPVGRCLAFGASTTSRTATYEALTFAQHALLIRGSSECGKGGWGVY